LLEHSATVNRNTQKR